MANSREVRSSGIDSGNDPRRRRALALRAHAPVWLHALAVFAFVRAAAIVAIAWFWLDHRDESVGEFSVIAWAVCYVTFELLAGFTLEVNAARRVPWGVSLTLSILAFGLLALGVVSFVAAALFALAPEWAAAVGLADNLVRVALIVAMLWPVVLARAEAIDARHQDASPGPRPEQR